MKNAMTVSHTAVYQCVVLKYGPNAGRHVWRSDAGGRLQTTGGSRWIGPFGARVNADEYAPGQRVRVVEKTRVTFEGGKDGSL